MLGEHQVYCMTNLSIKENLLYGGGFYQGLSRGEGYIYFYAIPNKKIEPKKIDKLIMEQIRILVKNELSSERLETEKKISLR